MISPRLVKAAVLSAGLYIEGSPTCTNTQVLVSAIRDTVRYTIEVRRYEPGPIHIRFSSDMPHHQEATASPGTLALELAAMLRASEAYDARQQGAPSHEVRRITSRHVLKWDPPVPECLEGLLRIYPQRGDETGPMMLAHFQGRDLNVLAEMLREVRP